MTWQVRLKRRLRRGFFVVWNAPAYLPVAMSIGKPPGPAYARAWQSLARRHLRGDPGPNLWLRRTAQGLHHRFRQTFRFFHPDFVPPIVLECDEATLEAMRESPAVVVAIHAYHEYAIARALERAGLAVSIVTERGLFLHELSLYGFDTPPLNIHKDAALMLEVRKALRGGRTVMCDVDYMLGKKTGNPRHYISTAMFEFRRMAKVPVAFAHTRIAADGTMIVVLRRPAPEALDPEGTETDAKTDAQAFIDFLDEVEQRKMDYTVRVPRRDRFAR